MRPVERVRQVLLVPGSPVRLPEEEASHRLTRHLQHVRHLAHLAHPTYRLPGQAAAAASN